MPSGNSSSPTSSAPSTKAGRGMRKGTKSCLECRKRKVKCVFGPDDANVCVTCKARGSKCTEQRKVIDHAATAASAKVTLEERVAQLESLIKSQAAGNSASSNEDHDSPRSYGEAVPIRTASMNFAAPEPTMSANVSDVSRTDVPHSVDPVVSLFDNPVWRNESNFGEGNPLRPPAMSGAVGGPGSFDGNHSTKIARTCAALLKDLPPSIILAAVLNATSSWWSTWRAGGNWLQEFMTKNNAKTLQDFIVISLSSSEPPVIALGILALAISLQQLDPNLHQDIMAQLPRPPGELFQIYFDRVERLIINDIDYSTSKAGIEVIMMSGKIFMNLGLVKRTWIFIHRAISHAQLLGYHRPHRTSAKETDYEMNIRQQIWFRICEQDAYTSLLLGLPYAADSKTIPQEIQGRKGSVSYFKYRLVRISAEIIDRNQMGRGCSLPLTQSIQQMLELAATEVDADFWDAPKALREAKITRSEYMDSLAAQFWHAQMKVVLHQPLMIQSIENNEFAQHREACLEACRNALRLYHFMRSDVGKAFSMVKFVDYQAFICSALLLLGLLGYGNPTSVYETIDQDKDWEIVQSTLDILRSASKGSNNSIATQAVQGLETLSALVRAGKTGQCAMSAEQCKNPHAQIVVPGSGTITVLPGTFLRRTVSPSAEPPNAHPPPVFHLSHGILQSLPSDGQSGQQRTYDKTAATGYPTSNDVANQIDAASAEFEIPYMDFDWTNMVDMNTADDWAWLADLNGNGMTGMI